MDSLGMDSLREKPNPKHKDLILQQRNQKVRENVIFE